MALRIVNYAVNGGGVGHLQRLIAVSRWIRRYAACADTRVEIYFLTSSEADGLLFHERFAGFKLPSKTVIGDAGIDKTVYLALAKQWVWHSLGLLRPDLLVVDTFPRGSFGELLGALDLCRRKAFIYRPTRDAFAGRADFQAMLPLYDLIAVPDRETVAVPAAVRDRVVTTAPVIARERVELADRAAARAQLGVTGDRAAIWISAGGGGDPDAEARLHAVIDALAADPALHLIVAAGPLYRGRARRGDRLTWLCEAGSAELLPGADLAISAAGYNSFFELMQAGVPALFWPQDKIADEQGRRAERAAAVGAGAVLPAAIEPSALRAEVAAWLEPGRRERAAAAARALVPHNGARELAADLLRLVLPAAVVDHAEAMVGDSLMAAARRTGVDLESLFAIARALDPDRTDAERAADHAGALVDWLVGRDIPVPAALRVLATFARKAAHGGLDERAAAARSLLEEMAGFGDWAGAATLMKLFGAERRLSPGGFVAELGRFLARLRGGGDDLYRGIAYLSAAQGVGADVPGNEEMLRRAAEMCR